MFRFFRFSSRKRQIIIFKYILSETSCQKTKKKIEDELNKCQVLCSNCHQDLHFDIDKFNTYKQEIYSWKYAEINPSTGKIPLTVNHVNGNPENTIEENLELICLNCHSLTPNYGSLNKGKGRKYRYKQAELW